MLTSRNILYVWIFLGLKNVVNSKYLYVDDPETTSNQSKIEYKDPNENIMHFVAVTRTEALTEALFTELEKNNDQGVKYIIEEAKRNNMSEIIEAKNSKRKRPVHIAAEKNNPVLLEYLFQEGANMSVVFFSDQDKYDFHQLTILHIAVRENFTELAEILLRKDPRTFKHDGTILQYAVQNNFIKLIPLLLFYIIPDITDSDGFTPMFYAVQRGNFEVVKMLQRAGASVNAISTVEHYNPLHFVGKATQNTRAIINYLVDFGANMEKTSLYGDTPLDLSLNGLNYEASKALIDKGASLKETYLLQAVDNNDPQIAALLIEGGADVSHCFAVMGWTGWHLTSYTKQLNLLGSLLLDSKKIDLQDHMGSTAVHIAVRNNFLKGVKILFQKGANINIKDDHSLSPIVLSLQGKHFEILNFLYSHGADVGSSTYESATYQAHLLFGKTIPEIIEHELGIKQDDRQETTTHLPHIHTYL